MPMALTVGMSSGSRQSRRRRRISNCGPDDLREKAATGLAVVLARFNDLLTLKSAGNCAEVQSLTLTKPTDPLKGSWQTAYEASDEEKGQSLLGLKEDGSLGYFISYCCMQLYLCIVLCNVVL